MTGFVLLRVRAHRLLLAAALLAVLLTTCVLAALTAFSGTIGDAALRQTLRDRAVPAALTISSSLDPADRAAADRAVRAEAHRTYGRLPVTVRKLETSGAYALPRELQPAAARTGEPDLTLFAAIDRTRVTLAKGSWPAATAGGPLQAALPEAAAARLRLAPGARFTVTDRLGGEQRIQVLLTGVYRPAEPSDPYWQLDSLGGRGVRTVNFTTYGPLLTDPAALGSGRVSAGGAGWLVSADFATLTTARVPALRDSAGGAAERLLATEAFHGSGSVVTGLPTLLDQAERALLVSRSTLLIVAVQLVLLAAYALLLVARLLSTERSGETDLLRARGGSRGRLASLALVEALLLAVPAALLAPLLSGPLTRLLADRSGLDRLGLHLGWTPGGTVWLVATAVAACCAAAVVAPALAADGGVVRLRRGRAAALPAPVRAGADVGLLIVAAVAYWQLDRQTARQGGALSGDASGALGIDPLLVAAPALALLAGTVLTLRLLPPAARLAERRAAGGRGLPAALAGWQFSRRPLRGAGPVLLLVLAVAMGVLAIGQNASWERSQRDQADFRAGASVRLPDGKADQPGRISSYTSLPGVRAATPAFRGSTDVSVSGTPDSAAVLALATGDLPEGLLLRPDLAEKDAGRLLAALTPAERAARPGITLPPHSRRVSFDARITALGAPGGRSPALLGTRLTVLVEDRFGISYRVFAGEVPVDGAAHPVTVDLAATGQEPAGPVRVTGFEATGQLPRGGGEHHRLVVDRLRATTVSGSPADVPVPAALTAWTGAYVLAGAEDDVVPQSLTARATASVPLSVDYRLADADVRSTEPNAPAPGFTVRADAPRPAPPAAVPAVVTDRFLAASGAERGDRVQVAFAGQAVPVRIVDVVRDLPTTGPGSAAVDSLMPADGAGAVLVDLDAVNRVLAHRGQNLTPNEWWLATAPGRATAVADLLRQRPDVDPAQVLVRDEDARELLSDPLGAGPRSALLAVAAVAAALAAVGFAVSTAGSLRERAAEFGVLRALGAPRRQLARLIAAEQGVLVVLSLLVGTALGALLTRAVVPLVVLTPQAARPLPEVLVQLPPGQVALLLAGVAALPLLIVAATALRRTDPAVTLRHQGDGQ
ncbi:FtsX-like permease family protein [Streptomyces sp. NPDC001941]|uniref:FtsX-like permease family protein n=1 Tax=Streptomyces sp. NPDC001941 TaxID=3154659 RepID=UPI00331C6BF4